MRDWPLRKRLTYRCHHADIVEHHRRILAGCFGRHDYERIVGAEQRNQPLTRSLRQQIELLARQPDDIVATGAELAGD